MTPKCIVIIGCFDTKGEVFALLRNQILLCGEMVLTINTGVMGSTELFDVDFEADQVALLGGATIENLREGRDRGHAMEVMGNGAAGVIGRLVSEKRVKAAIGMGGGGGTYIALSAMQPIPLGIPKWCLTTLATKDLSRQIGHKDITLMPSIVDVAGINSISSLLITQAATAICAMSNTRTGNETNSLGTIAISMFGNTTACVNRCTTLLEMKGYEVMAFHANGVGGRTMEALIREGCFAAVLDVTTTELADDLCGGICTAGPDRLTAAGAVGIPQVVVPGCMDMVNFGHPDTIPSPYRGRQLYSWAPDVTLMRTNELENEELGEQLVRKVSVSLAPSVIVLPLKGLSQMDADGNSFYRPEANQTLFDAIKKNVSSDLKVVEADFHINDPEFADVLVASLEAILDYAEIKRTL
jgi:uncharacterized protein (UPF0261 family)